MRSARLSASRSSEENTPRPSRGKAKGEGPGVLEVVEDHRGDTYRAVYTVQFRDAVYVLHAFQKKSTTGIKTPQRHALLIAERLKTARKDYEARHGADQQ